MLRRRPAEDEGHPCSLKEITPNCPRTQIMGVLGAKYYSVNGIWALKPYYLGPWTLRECVHGICILLEELWGYRYLMTGASISSTGFGELHELLLELSG